MSKIAGQETRHTSKSVQARSIVACTASMLGAWPALPIGLPAAAQAN